MTDQARQYRTKTEKPTPTARTEELADQRRYNVPEKPNAVPEGLKVLYG